MVNHFIELFSERYSRRVMGPKPEAMARIAAAPWPGNIRELQNAMARAVVLSTDGELDINDVFPPDEDKDEDENRERIEPRAPSTEPASLDQLPLCHAEAKKIFEVKYIDQLLTETRGNISAASKLSGKHRTELYRMLDRYSIDQQKFRSLYDS